PSSASTQRGGEVLQQAGTDPDRTGRVGCLALLGSAVARVWARGGFATAAVHQAICQARQERCERHEAICEAMSRPGMRFVAIKSAESQAELMLLGVRDLLIKPRTTVINAIRGHAAEFGVIAAKGPVKVAELLQRAHAEEASVPALALDMLSLLAAQLDALDVKLKLIETRLMASHRENPLGQCLASQPGIGPINAISFALRVTNPQSFCSGRHFAAWLGLTPKDNSSGSRHRQGRISRQGNEGLRKLVVLGATAVIRFARPGHPSPWLLNLLARKPKKPAAIALADKMARTLWAMMVSGEVYRRWLLA